MTQVSPARAVAPAPAAPTAEDRPAPPTPLAASLVALAPAAMGALIEAQAQLGGDASLFARLHVARKIDQLIDRLDGDPPPPPTDAPTFTVQRLQAARQALG